jgi:hypothetical protein
VHLQKYVDRLRDELRVAAGTAGADARELADRLTAALEPATRLVMLEVVTDVADEITRELSPGSVDVRLRGLDPSFVVTPSLSGNGEITSAPAPAEPDLADLESGPTVRINLRLPVALKERVEAAAARERLSVNTWLVRSASAVLASAEASPRTTETWRHGGQELSGWVH